MIAAFVRALDDARSEETVRRFQAWRRLFAAAARDEGDAMRLFAQATRLALVAKATSALSLGRAAELLVDPRRALRDRIERLERGALHEAGGVVGFVDADPFAWYLEEPAWGAIEPKLGELVSRLAAAPVEPGARDRFGDLVQATVPHAIRHTLGEFYTPGWLVARTIDRSGWRTDLGFADPTCGSGAFLVEALRRRIHARRGRCRARELLDGIHGMDLNPLAVLTSRASLVAAVAPWIDPSEPVRAPVVVGDALGDEHELPRVPFVCGNPPWVRWSQLPGDYAAYARARCEALGLELVGDRWVGGVEVDLSAAITQDAIERRLAPSGVLAFLVTGTLFTSAAGRGFRRFRGARVRLVEDYGAVASFDGASTHTALLVVERDAETRYPIPYRVCSGRDEAGEPVFRELLAAPVPGGVGGPWIKGTSEEHARWRRLFRRAGAAPGYRGRKGITTDLNGVFFVRVDRVSDGRAIVRNDPSAGAAELPSVALPVEAEHLFPLVRGRGVAPFRATPDPDYRVLVPQRGMHGDPDLATTAPLAWRYLTCFEAPLARRGSYRRFQRGKPYWSIWSTGPYTFASYKVLWREMPGGMFGAGYVGPVVDPLLGTRVVVPDHKTYFVPLEREAEAAYLTAILNAPLVASAVTAHATHLSLGVRVVEALAIPPFDPGDPAHARLATIARSITRAGRAPRERERRELDELVESLAGD